MTNLPDTWAINQRFIMLPINRLTRWAHLWLRWLLQFWAAFQCHLLAEIR
jgi:hypothetical protein